VGTKEKEEHIHQQKPEAETVVEASKSQKYRQQQKRMKKNWPIADLNW
jgi:hypothetical protein